MADYLVLQCTYLMAYVCIEFGIFKYGVLK